MEVENLSQHVQASQNQSQHLQANASQNLSQHVQVGASQNLSRADEEYKAPAHTSELIQSTELESAGPPNKKQRSH